MEILVDVYYKNEKTGKFEIFRETIKESELSEIIKRKTKEKNYSWMNDDFKYHSIYVDKIDL
jgi:hypothetical protein